MDKAQNISDSNKKVLDELMELYKKSSEGYKERKSFLYDGAVSPEDYAAANVKVVFLLKDAHQGHVWGGTQLNDLLEYANTGDINWNPKVIPPRLCLIYEEITGDVIQNKCEHLKQVAYVNVKKECGDDTCYNSKLNEFAQMYGDKLLEQLETLEADIIVCCGTFTALTREIMKRKYGIKRAWKKKRNEMMDRKPYFVWNLNGKEIKVIDIPHPSARGKLKNEEMYINIVKDQLN